MKELEDADAGRSRFDAERCYAESVFRYGIGDVRASIEAAERAVEFDPTYAPALLCLGSIEYQRRRPAKGKALFERLLALPRETEDLAEILDATGEFLIERERYGEGLALYRRAAAMFPGAAALQMGISCCADHLRRFDEALEASRRAAALEPENAKCVSDLGWSLFRAGRIEEAKRTLEKAVALDPTDDLAANNLAIVEKRLASRGKRRAPRGAGAAGP